MAPARLVRPFVRQLGGDRLGLGRGAQSKRSERLVPRTSTADKVVQSTCPYCAVGCGQKVYVKDEKVIQIEGDPDSPISRGRLCPKGAASEKLVNSPMRETRVKYRSPGAEDWEYISLGLAYLAELRGNLTLARRAWAAALVGNSVSPLLLSSDLGKPLRALNMFRMFKITSPMSVGSWILLANGNATGVATANVWLGLFPRLSKPARPAAALLGLPLSTYTAALIANTAVPVWHEARRELPMVFGSGAALSAGAAALAITPPRQASPARRLALTGAVLEAGTKEFMERRLGEHGQPYKEGQASMFGRIGQACIGVGAILAAGPGRTSRLAAVAAGALLSAGALSARWSVFRAGFQSAADPKYVVGPQRAAIARGERDGAARRGARLSTPNPRSGHPRRRPERR